MNNMKQLLTRAMWVILGTGVLGVLSVVLVVTYFSFDLPKISSLADYHPPIPSQILSRDGTVLTELGIEKREVAQIDEIPRLIIDAFLSAEDDNFYKHTGVDYLGVLRALYVNLREGRVVQGGSTITQQVAKSLLLTRERSITRKIKDFLLAQRIEEKFSKGDILYLYLNQVYLGGGYYGVKAAFRGYFGKELSEATVAETAMIAGLLVAPGKYSPYVNPAYAKKRQRYVLNRMFATEKITEQEFRKAIDEKIKFRLRKKSEFKAGYFTDWVRQRVIELVGKDNFLSNGFRVQTTLDWELQKIAEREVISGAKAIDKRQGFKGPIGSITEVSDREEFEIKFRKKTYESHSQYFTLTEDNKRQYELVYEDQEVESIKESLNEWLSNIRDTRFHVGNNKDDKLLRHLEIGESYKAVVLDIDDEAQLVYVSLGGLKGFIPYEFFRWAHERQITEERNFYPYIRKPSTILKKGDVVLVELKRKSSGLKGWINKNFAKKLASSKDSKLVNKQSYLLVGLDQAPDAQGALVSMLPKTGEVLAFVGGVDFSKSQFNRAIQSKRQPGSSFKPILFAAGLENGYTPSSIIIDSPEALGGVDSSLNWKPRNYDGKFKGPITFRDSLEQSRNIPTIKIADKLGVPTVLDFVERIGFNAKLDPDLSLSLGSFGVTLMDIVSTYAIFPNGGKKIKPKSIVSIVDRYGNQFQLEEEVKVEQNEIDDESLVAKKEEEKSEDGEETEESEEEKEETAESDEPEVNPFYIALGGDQVYDPRLAYLMTNLLRGVVLHGTGKAAKDVSTFLGGKTGTTNNYVDAWFLGFSSNIVTGVWTGFDDNKTLGWGETGAKAALPIWKEFMRSGLKKLGEFDFQVPLGIINVKMNKKTGRLAKSKELAFLEAFVEGTEPGSEEKEEELKTNEEGKIEVGGQILEEDDYFDNQ